jgi:hypothetical protein
MPLIEPFSISRCASRATLARFARMISRVRLCASSMTDESQTGQANPPRVLLEASPAVSKLKPRAHFFAGLEEWNDLLCNLHFSTGLGISTFARSANLGSKDSETPKLNSIPATQSFDDLVKYHVDDLLYVALVKVPVLRSDASYQVGF